MTSHNEIEAQIANLHAMAADIRSAKAKTKRITDPDIIRKLDDAMSAIQKAIKELQENLHS